jgi:hypothetical protein
MVKDPVMIYLYLSERLAFGNLHMAFANGMHSTVLNLASGYPPYLNEFNLFIRRLCLSQSLFDLT